MAYSDVLLAVDCDSVPAWDQGYGIVYQCYGLLVVVVIISGTKLTSGS